MEDSEAGSSRSSSGFPPTDVSHPDKVPGTLPVVTGGAMANLVAFIQLQVAEAIKKASPPASGSPSVSGAALSSPSITPVSAAGSPPGTG